MKVDAPPSCIDYCVPPSSTITKPPLLHNTWRAVYYMQVLFDLQSKTVYCLNILIKLPTTGPQM